MSKGNEIPALEVAPGVWEMDCVYHKRMCALDTFPIKSSIPNVVIVQAKCNVGKAQNDKNNPVNNLAVRLP